MFRTRVVNQIMICTKDRVVWCHKRVEESSFRLTLVPKSEQPSLVFKAAWPDFFQEVVAKGGPVVLHPREGGGAKGRINMLSLRTGTEQDGIYDLWLRDSSVRWILYNPCTGWQQSLWMLLSGYFPKPVSGMFDENWTHAFMRVSGRIPPLATVSLARMTVNLAVWVYKAHLHWPKQVLMPQLK